jgi:hypothetical protein
MPNRILREGILTSERVNALAHRSELFYRRLMSVVDDYGRFSAHPGLLRAACFPLKIDEVREADISRWLTEVESAGLILLYAVDGKPYLELTGLGSPRAKESRYPAPPEAPVKTSARTCAQKRPSSYSGSSAYSGSEKPAAQASTATADAATVAAAAAFLTFPCCAGKRSKDPTWALTEDYVVELAETFPAVDVRAECREALGWVRAKPANRKTADGMREFLFRWMKRSQNGGGQRRGANGARHAAGGSKLEQTLAMVDSMFADQEAR